MHEFLLSPTLSIYNIEAFHQYWVSGASANLAAPLILIKRSKDREGVFYIYRESAGSGALKRVVAPNPVQRRHEDCSIRWEVRSSVRRRKARVVFSNGYRLNVTTMLLKDAIGNLLPSAFQYVEPACQKRAAYSAGGIQ